MRKVIALIVVSLGFTSGVNAQTFEFYQTDNIHNKLRLNTKTGELYQMQSDGAKYLVQPPISSKNQSKRYSLHKTKNMWTYILLDEFDGRLWQCQYSISDVENISCLDINSKALSTTKINKFAIEPLTSMFQNYLINQQNGEMWKFQWSLKGNDYRWIEKF